MKTTKSIVSLAAAIIVSCSLFAKEDISFHKKTNVVDRVLASGCSEDQGAAYLAINNVRARIMDEGDMWWDPGAGLPRYYEPASSPTCPLFAGALWIAGLDAGGQLKVAAMTYRQNGEDFWTGPLDTLTVSITPTECANWDKLFYVTRQEVQNFVSYGSQYLTSDIKSWPGNGNPALNEGHYLAPFVDVGQTGTYDPTLGDYPAYDLKGTNTKCQNEIFGDATLWWVINDEGNIHSESGGLPIGLEVRCQAFAFQTNDAINNCTFYNYQIINRSSYQMNQTYFGAWVDPDLGNGGNDYVGCDVSRGFGFCYNGTSTDPDGSGQFAGEIGYHSYLPAVGVDFFQGPKADPKDTNCYVHGGLIGMARFVYYNNDFTVMGNPTNATHYYNYLKGLWTDGTPMTYSGNGYQSSTTPCSYMFPWIPAGYVNGQPAYNSDLTNCGTNFVPETTPWDEYDAKDPPGDRRFIQSAGPFTLAPGAVNYVTTGVVFDQTSTQDNQFLPIGLIQQDDDLAQALFNNCFKVLNGPDAPDMTIQELNQEIIITLSNNTTSNNYKEHYTERSPTIVPPYTDTMYVFEGYEIFQVLDSAVTATQLLDPAQARLVAQCDVKDGVTQLVNYNFNSTVSANVPTLEVTGADKGIVHSFDIKADQFQEDGITNLVNDRPYYYIAIAYGYNNYCTYNPNGPDSLLKGQKLPFLQGRRNIKVATAIPHIPSAQNYGTVQQSNYGDQPAITRIEGHGNGRNTVELDQNSIDYILANNKMETPSYVPGQGPITVKVVDPLSVVAQNYIVKLMPGPKAKGLMDSTATWKLYVPGVGDTVYSDSNIGYQNEQVLPQWGISVTILDDSAAKAGSPRNIVLDSSCSLTFNDPTKNWLSGVSSASQGVNPLFWIRCGNFVDKTTPDAPAFSSIIPGDPNCNYDAIINGTVAPYFLAAASTSVSCDNGPRFAAFNVGTLANLASVDIVFTSDMSKWTRCVVVEEQDNPVLAQGGAAKLQPRACPSVDQWGNYAKTTTASSNPTDPEYISATGMGWFPGYAINLETGERLNMAFGEDSWLTQDNGRDMRWNPDSIMFRQNTGAYFGASSVFGGKHYIYVFGHNRGPKTKIPIYDKDSTLISLLPKGGLIEGECWGDAMWVNIPLLRQGHSVLECDATMRIRVTKPYDSAWGANWHSATPQNNNYPMYSFSTGGMNVETNNATAAQNALNLINIVPNPYYGYSSYESDKLDTRVRITNLPPTCTITIFALNGTLIQVINKQNPLTYQDWNLQNQFNVPIASGMYLVHIAVPNVGERTLKWFGVMRPLDLNSY
jgi:hypothetical protein